MKGKLSTTVAVTVTLTRRGQCVLGGVPFHRRVGGSSFGFVSVSENGSHIRSP